MQFWTSRRIYARRFCFYVNASNTIYQASALLDPQSQQHFIINGIYSVGSLICYIMMWISFKKPPKISAQLIWWVSAYLAFRNSIRLFDFEGTRLSQEELLERQEIDMFINAYKNWYILVLIQMLVIYQLMLNM